VAANLGEDVRLLEKRSITSMKPTEGTTKLSAVIEAI
jgi:hypothetical protein